MTFDTSKGLCLFSCLLNVAIVVLFLDKTAEN